MAEPSARWAARFVPALALVVLLGGAVRLGALATATECRPGAPDEAIAAALEPGGDCVLFNDALYYETQSRMNREGHWFEMPTFEAADPRAPAATHPPLYAVFLTGLRFFGLSTFDQLRAATALLGLVTVAGAGLVGRRLAGPRAGLLAALLVAVHPMVWLNDIVLMSEALYGPAVLLVIGLALRYRDRPALRAAVLLGAAIGAASLVRSEAVLAAPLVGVPLMWRQGERWRHLGALAGTALLVASPWLAWNLARFHEPVLYTSTAGTTMIFGNCPDVYDGPRLGSSSPTCTIEGLTAARSTLPADADDSDTDAVLRRRAVAIVGDDPAGATRASLARAGRMWGLYRPFQTITLDEPSQRRGEGRSQLGVVLGWQLMVAAAIGARALWRRRGPVAPLVAWIAISTLVALGTLGLHRFRSGAELALCLLAAVGIDWLLSPGRRPVTPPEAAAPASR